MSNIKYVHIRPGVTYDTHARKLVGEPLPKGGVTIAFTFNPVTRDINVAIAQCHERDAYSRLRGRQIAGGRLATGLYQLMLNLPEDKGIVEHVVKQVGGWLEYHETLRAAA